jgi:NAD+ synthase
MSWVAAKLEIDPVETSRQIEDFIQNKLVQLGRTGLLLGLSGGLDSAIVAFLAVRAVGSERVGLLNLPDRDSRPRHIQHARLIARTLGVELQSQEMTPLLQEMGVYDLLPFQALPRTVRAMVTRIGKKLAGPEEPEELLAARLCPPPHSWMAKGNAYAMVKHRLRMVLLYLQADLQGLLVVGAANRTEYLTGTFSHWGCDQCADMMPLLHLYRSQLPPLAEYLQVPEEIRVKAADPDFLPGVNDKEALLGSFEVTDQILWGLEHGVSRAELAEIHGEEVVARIATLKERSRPLRETPYCLEAA